MIRLAHKVGSFGLQNCRIIRVDHSQLVRMLHSLVNNQAYVNGKWTNAGDNKCFNVINPANQKVVGSVPDMNAADVEKAIDYAYDAFHSKSWQNTTAKDRSNMLKVRRCHPLNQLTKTNQLLEMVPTSRAKQARNR